MRADDTTMQDERERQYKGKTEGAKRIGGEVGERWINDGTICGADRRIWIHALGVGCCSGIG